MAPILRRLEVKAKRQFRKASILLEPPFLHTTIPQANTSNLFIHPCSKGRWWEGPRMGVAWRPSA